MLATLGIVELSPRALHGTVKPDRKLGGHSWLELAVRRVTDCLNLSRVVVPLGAGAELAALQPLIPPDVPLVVTHARDALGRHLASLTEHPALAVVRIRLDHPYFDPALADRLVTAAAGSPGCDYAGYRLRDGRPAASHAQGLCVEWLNATALKQVGREAIRTADRERVSSYLTTRPERFRLLFLELPGDLERDDLRFAIDNEEDWDHAQEIYEALGPDGLDPWLIDRLVRQQPQLRERMTVLNGRDRRTVGAKG